MTKQGVLDFFGVMRAFALALALTGLVLFLGSVATSILMHSTLMALSAVLLPGTFGFGAMLIGVVLALICSLTRFLVARMRFQTVPLG